MLCHCINKINKILNSALKIHKIKIYAIYGTYIRTYT